MKWIIFIALILIVSLVISSSPDHCGDYRVAEALQKSGQGLLFIMKYDKALTSHIQEVKAAMRLCESAEKALDQCLATAERQSLLPDSTYARMKATRDDLREKGKKYQKYQIWLESIRTTNRRRIFQTCLAIKLIRESSGKKAAHVQGESP